MEQFVTHPIIFFLVSMAVMSLAAWFGATILRRRKPLDSDAREDFGTVQSATLTLLALVIGFSLSMAVGRYDQRKNYEEEEANAIGTELLRVELLPGDAAKDLQPLLEKYLNERIEFYQVRDPVQLTAINAATAQTQTDMWGIVRTAAIAQPTPVTALAVAGMNDLINTQGYTQAALWNRIPPSAWALMILIGLFCNVMVGYGLRSVAVTRRLVLVMPLVVSLSFMIIADIDSPRNGIIRLIPQNLISVAQSFSK